MLDSDLPPPARPDGGAASEIPSLPPGVTLVTLDSGLTVILLEDHSAPVVAAQAWCRTGSIDEGSWLGAGLSHVLEHMLFKGTSTRGPGRIDQEVQEAGGYLNAYTSFDHTVYWINVPNTGARVALDVLADIMCHATLPPEELTREMDVIRREMDMNHDDPARRASRRLFETAYTRSPYRWTVIGYPDVFNQLTRHDVLAYYRQRYVPNNLFFTVVGDFCPAEALDRLKQGFAGVKTRPLPPTVLPEEPRQMAPRETIEEAPIEVGHAHFSWHIPGLRHPDLPAVEVLATLLGGGRSSRLYQKLHERLGLVLSTDAWLYSPGGPGLFGVSAVMEAPKFAAAREAALAEIQRLRAQPVPPEEVRKATKQLTSATLASRKTFQGRARDLGGCWLAAGDLSFSERYLAAIQAVQPDDVLRVAREYLTAENRTLYALLPPGARPAAPVRLAVSEDDGIQKTLLSNGLRLLAKASRRLPFVEFRLVLRGGVLAETEANNGLTRLLAQMLLQGTVSRSAEEVALAVEAVGGTLDAYSGNNSFGLNLEVLNPDFDLGLELLADVLLHPAFPAEAFDRERLNQLAAIRAQRDQILSRSARLLRETLFGRQGYGLDLLGNERSVAALEPGDLRAFHGRLAAPENAVLAIFGDVRPREVVAQVEKIFASWTPPAACGIEAPRTPEVPLRGLRRACETDDKKQAVVWLGFRGADLHDPDRFALELIQEACSDLGSRLFLRIRERLGLAYFVGAQNFLGMVPGYFAFYAGTAPEQAPRVEQELLAEAALLAAEGLTEPELRRAKAKILGQKKIARQDLGALAQAAALDELYGLGYLNFETEDARFEAVTLEETRAVAREYLGTGNGVVAVVSPGDSPGAEARPADPQP